MNFELGKQASDKSAPAQTVYCINCGAEMDVTQEKRRAEMKSDLQAELDRAVSELQSFREADRYFRELFKTVAPQCECLPTLSGVATQIDNYIAGLRSDFSESLRIREIQINDLGVLAAKCGEYMKQLENLASYAATARDENQPEWMEGLVEHLNQSAVMLNDPTQFVLRKKLGREGFGEMWITAKKIP